MGGSPTRRPGAARQGSVLRTRAEAEGSLQGPVDKIKERHAKAGQRSATPR